MNSNITNFYAIPIVWLLWVSGVVAEEYPFTPARFTEGEFFLGRLIEYPDVEGDSQFSVNCNVEVSNTGFAVSNLCIESDSIDERFYDSIRSAMKTAKVTPAVVDGKPRRAILNYRVIFLKRNDETLVGVYPNWGNDIEKYGIDYEAPQKYGRAFKHVWCYPYGSYKNVATMTIGADGVLKGEIEFLFDTGRNARPCESEIRRKHEEAKYIPGHHAGKPVEATYNHPWDN
jgi:hypothetical protein